MHLDSLPPFGSEDLLQCCSSCTPLNSPFSPDGGGHHSQQQQQQHTIFHFPATTTASGFVEHYPVKEEWPLDSHHHNHHQQQQQPVYQYSPMVVSPANQSLLNTPRGSITSIRSRQQSPMNTEVMLLQQPQQHSRHPSPFLEEPVGSLLAFGAGDNIYEEEEHSFYPTYPSPPRSGYASPVYQQQQCVAPPSYDQHMSLNYYCGDSGHFLSEFNHQQQQQEDIAQQQQQPLLHHHGGSVISLLGSSDAAPTSSCPETPDSSIKEEVLCEIDTGNYCCRWLDCTMEFECQRSLVDHVTEAHVESAKKGCEERPCLWQDCPRKLKPFNAKYKLSTHMRVHTKEKPYKCEYEGCTRAFARLENRKIHLRSHTGHKPFPCKYFQEFNCNKKFSNSSDRAKHEQTHKDPKPYRCEVVGCSKRYTDPSSLRKHVKSHSQEEQLQYRLYKDHVNQAKSSNSSSGGEWRAEEEEEEELEQKHRPDEFISSSSTMLAVGLQSGGTVVNLSQQQQPHQSPNCSPSQLRFRESDFQQGVSPYSLPLEDEDL